MKRLIVSIAAALFLAPAIAAADTQPLVTSDACEELTARNIEPGLVLRLEYHDLAHSLEVTIETDPQTWTEIRPGGTWTWALHTGRTQDHPIVAEGSVDLAVCPVVIESPEPTMATIDPTPRPTLPPTDTLP